MRQVFRHKRFLGLIAVLLVLVAIGGIWQYHSASSVEASGVVSIDIGQGSHSAPGLDAYTTCNVTNKSTNQYELDYPGAGSKIEIGDVAKGSSFKPDLTFSTWNREAEFKLISTADTVQKSQLSASFAGDTISAANGEWKFDYTPTKPKSGFNEKGGVDMLITAKVKPASNKIYFTFNSGTVTPCYQPPLTTLYKDGWSDEFQCEIKVTETQVTAAKETKTIKAGTILSSCPDYVVGSIAFYANSKAHNINGGTNYSTGKVGHLYAMQCNGQWCRWSIEGQNIVLTIPQAIIDAGTYPLTIAPVGDTFGYNTVGSNLVSMGANVINANGDSITGAAGTGTSMSVYVAPQTSLNGIRMAIYKSADNSLLTNGTTNEVTIPGWSAQWVTANFTSAPTLTTAGYYLAFNRSDLCQVYFDYTATNWAKYQSSTYGTWTNPATWSTIAGEYRKYSLYVTYTPGTSTSISNSPTSYNFGAINANGTIATGLNYFTVTNTSGSAVNITISGTDITGGTTWTLSDTATPGANTIGMQAGLSGGAYNINVKKTAPFNTLKSNLAANANQSWGLQLLAPTSYSDNVQKAGTITLTATTP